MGKINESGHSTTTETAASETTTTTTMNHLTTKKNMTADSIKFFNRLHKLFVTFAISDVKVQEVNFILS